MTLPWSHVPGFRQLLPTTHGRPPPRLRVTKVINSDADDDFVLAALAPLPPAYLIPVIAYYEYMIIPHGRYDKIDEFP